MNRDTKPGDKGRAKAVLGAGLASALIAAISGEAEAGSVTIDSRNSTVTAYSSTGRSYSSGWSGTSYETTDSDGATDEITDVNLAAGTLSAAVSSSDAYGHTAAASAEGATSILDAGGTWTFSGTGTGSASANSYSYDTDGVATVWHWVRVTLDGLFDFEMSVDFGGDLALSGHSGSAFLYDTTNSAYLVSPTTVDTTVTGQLSSGQYYFYFHEQARADPYRGYPYSVSFTGLAGSLTLTDVTPAPGPAVPLPGSAWLGFGMMLALGLAWLRTRWTRRRLRAAFQRS